jgi:NDP-sugar pyrophosphorylase family protein
MNLFISDSTGKSEPERCVKIGVLAVGGKGTRYGKEAESIQKVLLPLDGKPVIDYAIEAMMESGVRVIYLLTGYKHEEVNAHKKPDSIAIIPISPFVNIAPEHAIVEASDTGEIQTVGLPGNERNPKKITHVDTGIYYFRSKVFEYLSQVAPDRPMAEFMTLAMDAGESIIAMETTLPWFVIHTKTDLEKWENSPMRARKNI